MSEIVDRFFPAIFGHDVSILVCGLMFPILASVCHGSPFLRARGSFSRLPGRSNQVEIFCFERKFFV